MGTITNRIVRLGDQEITYQLERKKVKNMNLRVRKDGTVYASAGSRVPAERVDAFVLKNADFVFRALNRRMELAQRRPAEKEYVSGEDYTILGRHLTLEVRQGQPNRVWQEEDRLILQVKDPQEKALREKTMKKYRDECCSQLFEEVLTELYPKFEIYGVKRPQLRSRDMKSRWGSCMVQRGIITMNKRLLTAPRSCTEYIMTHELCHLLQADHSPRFYAWMDKMMPEWRLRKKELSESEANWL